MKIKEYNTEDYYLDNKYTKWYTQLVEKAITRDMKRSRKGFTEVHHILPKSIVNELKKEKTNLVVLTPKEHFIAHLLLTKMGCTDLVRQKTKAALICMTLVDSCGSRYTPCSRIYEYVSKINSESSSGDNSPQVKLKKLTGHGYGYGLREVSNPETLETIRVHKDDVDDYVSKGMVRGNLKTRGINHHRSSKIICLNNKKVYESIIEASIDIKRSEASLRDVFNGHSNSCGICPDTNQKLVWLKYKDYNEDIDYTDHVLSCQKHPGSTTGRKAVNNGECVKYIPEDKIEAYIAQGWVMGNVLK